MKYLGIKIDDGTHFQTVSDIKKTDLFIPYRYTFGRFSFREILKKEFKEILEPL